MTMKGILAAAAVVIASLVSVGVTQPAFAAAGGLDPTFGNGGKVLTALGGGADQGAVLQPNGDIVIGGTTGLIRLLPNGSPDTSFGTGGLAQTSFSVNSLALQPNGEFLAAGGGNGDFAVARFTTAGTLDPAFGHGGVVTTAFPQAADGAVADAVLMEPNGDVLVGGKASVPGTAYNVPVVALGALARYTPSGTLDPSFGSGGIVQSTASIGNIGNLGIDASGDIFVLPAHAEFSPAGQLDSSVTPAAITASTHGRFSAFLPTGQSLIISTAQIGRVAEVQVRRFNADGSVDTAFNNPPFSFTGTLTGHQGDSAIAVQPDGKIVVVGQDFAGSSLFGAARLNAGGSLDSGFGNAGVLTTNFQGRDSAGAVLIQPNGDIVSIGFSENNTTGAVDTAIARYLG